MSEGRIAASDPKVGPAARRHVDAGDGCGRGRRVTRGRVRDAGAELQRGGLAGGESEADERVAGEVLRVDDRHPVEALGFGPGRGAGRDRHVRQTDRPDLERHAEPSWRRPYPF